MSAYISEKFYESGYERKSVSKQIAEWLNKNKPESFIVVKMSGNETEIVALMPDSTDKPNN